MTSFLSVSSLIAGGDVVQFPTVNEEELDALDIETASFPLKSVPVKGEDLDTLEIETSCCGSGPDLRTALLRLNSVPGNDEELGELDVETA